MFNPQCVQAFQSLARKEAFWLDCTSKRIYNLVVGMVEMTPIEAADQTIQGIAEIFARLVDAMSRWTATHSSGVAATAVALSRHLNLSAHDQIRMRTAGLLHDLGKLSVPPEILDHPGKMTEKQWASIKAHPYYTYRILETTGFPRPIVEWASFHHERLDGTGYPFHVNDEQLTLGSRIMAVADIFTALTEVRPYRQGLAKDDAIAALTQMVRAGGIDAEVVNTLVEHFDAIDETRRQEQDRYAERQKALSEIIPKEGTGFKNPLDFAAVGGFPGVFDKVFEIIDADENTDMIIYQHHIEFAHLFSRKEYNEYLLDTLVSFYKKSKKTLLVVMPFTIPATYGWRLSDT